MLSVTYNTSRYQQDEGSQTLFSSLTTAKTPRHVTYEVINVVLKIHLNLHFALLLKFTSLFLKHYRYLHQMVIWPVQHLRGHDLINGIQE